MDDMVSFPQAVIDEKLQRIERAIEGKLMVRNSVRDALAGVDKAIEALSHERDELLKAQSRCCESCGRGWKNSG